MSRALPCFPGHSCAEFLSFQGLPSARGTEMTRWHWAPQHFWKCEARAKGHLDLNLLKTLSLKPTPLPHVCIFKACMTWPDTIAEQPKCWCCPRAKDLPPAFKQAGAQRPSPRTGDTHPPVPSLAGGPSCAFGLAQARWQEAQVRPPLLVRRQDNTFQESCHPSNISIVREGLIVKATRGGMEEEPASGRSLMETGSGQGLQQAPRRERHQSSTAGPSTAFQPLWAYLASCCDSWLPKNPSPGWLWWRHFGSFISKTINVRLKIQPGSGSSVRELLHPSARQLQRVITKLATGTCN